MRPISKLFTAVAGALVAATLAAAAPAQADDGRRGGYHDRDHDRGGKHGRYDDRHDWSRHHGYRPGHGPHRYGVAPWPAYRVHYAARHAPPVYRYTPSGLVIIINP
jgi:Ni/Co efflux regulator RcnB